MNVPESNIFKNKTFFTIQVEIPATPRPQTKFPHGQGKAMAEGGITPKHVKALHNFKGSNNDEVSILFLFFIPPLLFSLNHCFPNEYISFSAILVHIIFTFVT